MSERSSFYAEAHRLEDRGEAFAIAFIIDAVGSVPRSSGRMIVRIDGTISGTVGGGPFEAQVIQEAVEALRLGESRTVIRRLTPRGEDAAGMECGGTMKVRIDVNTAAPRLLLVGGGHVNLAIAKTAAPLGFAIEVAESREEFCTKERFPMASRLWFHKDLAEAVEESAPDANTWIVVATHDDDIRIIGHLAAKDCAYLGMLGSKRKVAVAVASLRSQGLDEERIASLRAPIGLDIGAETPEEIAMSVMAEILKVRSGRSGLPLQGMSKDLVVVRGGGDLASGTVWRLARSGFKVLILETEKPTVIRRTVAFAAAVLDGDCAVEGLVARRADDIAAAYDILESGDIPVLVDPQGRSLETLKPAVVVDAILAKKNLGTHRALASIVVALGPGFRAGPDGDCHAVVETHRGHELGRVITRGEAAANTGTPGIIGNKGAERVLRAPTDGVYQSTVALGQMVREGDVVAKVDGQEICAPFAGKVRGLLSNGLQVTRGFKVGDIDPRGEDVDEFLISDKARAVAGGVLEAILYLRTQRESR